MNFISQTMAQMSFWIIVGFTLTGAVIAVFPRNILYNVLGLVLTLTGVAGLFVFLGSMFIGLMQLLIYVGAVCIAIVFAIMMSRPLHLEVPKRKMPKVVMAATASFIFAVGIMGVIFRTSWKPAAERSTDWSIVTIGDLLLTRYSLIFEAISLVFLVAILGAIVTAGFSRRLSS
jgi:NADH-quinone oxidoreductase subunit J